MSSDEGEAGTFRIDHNCSLLIIFLAFFIFFLFAFVLLFIEYRRKLSKMKKSKDIDDVSKKYQPRKEDEKEA